MGDTKDTADTARAVWRGRVLAESDDVVRLEGNVYFPADSLDNRYFESSDHHSICPWKGRASYLHAVTDGHRAPNAAWYYPKPLPPARKIEGRIAFANSVKVQDLRDRVA